MTLDVLISTIYPSGIDRLASSRLPRVDGVTYIVSWQQSSDCEVPAVLLRDDIKIFRHESTGLSVNRNYALSKATSDICLIADDDLEYEPEMLMTVISTFEANPGVELAMFMFEGDDPKRYADCEFDLKSPPPYFYVTEIEMAFLRKSVQGLLSFSPLLGLGAPEVHAGEGEMFFISAMRKGLSGRFFPKVIARHHGLTTGNRASLSPGVIEAKGVILYMKHPVTWPLHVIINALREHRHRRCKAHKALLYLYKGAVFARRNFNLDGTPRHQSS